MINLKWVTCGDHWCSLETVNLSNVTSEGIYVIWHEGAGNNCVYVGQGGVADRLEEHRNNPLILRHASKGALRVTWAVAPLHQRDGIERYLRDTYTPLEGVRWPEVVPIAVNLPGQ